MDLILSEASIIVARQKPPVRSKHFYSTQDVHPDLLTDEKARELRETQLVEKHMPFLFQLITHKLSKTVALPIKSDQATLDGSECQNESGSEREEADSDEELLDGELRNLKGGEDRKVARSKRIYTTSRTICSMVSFVLNRRDNAVQLENSLAFVACGVSNRVNLFLHHIGLTSSNQTANKALKTLGRHAENHIASVLDENNPIAPILCIDNLDFEQRIHSKSLGNDSQMFHGTWGYIHQIDRALLSSVSPSDLTLESYLSKMEEIPSLVVSPKMLIPSPEDEKHWVLVLKSQIAKVLLTYIAKPAEKRTTIAITPTTIKQISHKPPDITMIKLMIASDNSAQGIGEVCTGIIQQSNLDETEFSSRLQVIHGDLATCANIQSLQSQRVPSEYSADTITNLLTLLGGSHTLWNIGLAIFELHYGNTSDSRDCGAWRWLDSLGIPSTKTLDKKDFTKMIQNMEKIHEATIVYCIMCVMGIQNSSLTNQLSSLPGKTIESIIDKTYHQYFSARAKSKAA
ncbi:hypothetical protein PGT21_027890 [Puccinia graminis f. sp. tritici]|uniref:DUF6589 domain-containing protein n=1 Tax=Puccinia graminis f. sp. tritici TaxID=56615 RepID=A0A5B0Q6W3_PUCGR|nr:hypothetical protein PGT21_027890 [Puccinia graminis f. sp. tritici]